MFANMINAYALHKIILDDLGRPVDYVFLEVNDSFERFTGLKRKNIIGKRVTEVIPSIRKDHVDWIDKYGKVATTGKAIRFENYSTSLQKWYSISAYSPEKNYFVTIFEDITERAGVATSVWATGVSMVDVNSDGWLDIYISVAGQPE
ncbi:MAG: PAS domain S-box protein, partial [Candidatus Bathyarchaeota archaeon]